MTLSYICRHFNEFHCKISSGPAALSEFKEWMILFMFSLVAFGKHLLLNRQFNDYNTCIISTSSKGFAESPNEDGLIPEDFSTILM